FFGDKLSAGEDAIAATIFELAAGWVALQGAKENTKSAQENVEIVKLNQEVIPALKEKEEKFKAALCKEAPATPGCVPLDDPRNECPEWEMESGPIWVNSEDTNQEMTMADRIEQCTCEAIKSISGSF